MEKFDSGEICTYINMLDTHYYVFDQTEAIDGIDSIRNELKKYPNNIELNESIISNIEELFDSQICYSPLLMLDATARLNPRITEYIKSGTDLGSDIYESLERVCAFRFLDKMKPHRRTEVVNAIDRLIATFVMCTFGPSKLSEVPIEAVNVFIDGLRTEDGSDWNTKFFGKCEPLRIAARNIVNGLSIIFGEKSLSGKMLYNEGKRRSGMAWDAFMVSNTPLNIELRERLHKHSEESRLSPKMARQVTLDLSNWLCSQYPNMSLTEIFISNERKKGFPFFLEDRRANSQSWRLSQTRTAKRLLDAYQEGIALENNGAVLKPLISDKEIRILENSGELTLTQGTRTASRALPDKLYALAKRILDQGESGPLGKYSVFQVKIKVAGEQQSVFCPVIPTLLRSAFDIPLRIVQWRRLDSGEGDTHVFNPRTGEMEENTSPLRGYWQREPYQSQGLSNNRGYAFKFTEDEGGFVGFYINTNKTGRPYAIPWQHREVHTRLYDLLQWQIEHNPISHALEPIQYLDAVSNVPTPTRRQMPDILPLFRLFPKTVKQPEGRIPTPGEMDRAWRSLMVEVERGWNSEHPDEPVNIVKYDSDTKQCVSCIYNLHGLRKKGLIDLYSCGIPLELISKYVAGHASLRMTLSYIDFDAVNLSGMLENAARNNLAKEQRSLINDFKAWQIAEARERTVGLIPQAIEEAVRSESKLEYCNVDIGFCPFDCTRCHDGGPRIRTAINKDGSDDSLYGPVPGGEKNCVACRHFVTGPPWTDQLCWYGTMLSEKRKTVAKAIEAINQKVAEARAEMDAERISVQLYRQTCDALQQQLMPLNDKLEAYEISIFNTEMLATACLKLMYTKNGRNGNALVVNKLESIVEYAETTEFENSMILTSFSEFYPIFHDQNIESFRNRHLDRVLFSAGITPPDFIVGLTESQRKQSHSLFSNWLMQRTTLHDRIRLIANEASLVDLGYRDEVESLISGIVSAPVAINQSSKQLAGW